MVHETNQKHIGDPMDETLKITNIILELHGIFWFHTAAQPREDYYIHITLDVIHNYPLTLAFLGHSTEETYADTVKNIKLRITPEKVWKEHGFYIYPAVGIKHTTKTITFTTHGIDYINMKLRTRAPIPDLTANQVFIPNTQFETFIITKKEETPKPSFIRLGTKRYGIFKVKYEKTQPTKIETNTEKPATHPYNTRDTNLNPHTILLRHYAGHIAILGTPQRIIHTNGKILAVPHFITD